MMRNLLKKKSLTRNDENENNGISFKSWMPIHNLAIMILYFNVSMILLTVRQLQSQEAFFNNVTLINTYTCTIFFTILL